jgi:hypothetical protein
MTENKPKYRFYTEVTCPETGNTVGVQWDNLTSERDMEGMK